MINGDQTKLLRDAQRTLGKEALSELLPKPLVVWVSDHDTGCQARIELREEGRETVWVWQGSIWYSYSYEFNDRDKKGWNEAARFAFPKVTEFFAKVVNAHVDREANRVATHEQQKEQGEQKLAADIEHYKEAFID